MITSSLFSLVAIVAALANDCTTPSRFDASFSLAANDAPFQDLTFEQALAAAKKDQKIVMFDFFTTWCVPCKKLDKVTWTDKDVQAWVAKTAVAIKLDAEKEVEL